MIAPAAFEDITFPQQGLVQWSQFESNQWFRGIDSYFTPNNGVIYGSPTEIGSTYSGTAKWNGGAMTPSGKLYAPGHLATDWLVVDTNNDNIYRTGSVGAGNTNGAFYSPLTNAVYAASSNPQMNKIVVSNDSGSSVSLPAFGSQYFPFLLSHDGTYAWNVGTYVTKKAVKYDILNETATDTGVATSGDRANAVMAGNGKMYWGNGGTTTFIEWNPTTNTSTTFGSINSDGYQTLIATPDGYIYALPTFSSTTIKRINPNTREVVDVVTGLSGAIRTTSATFGADGLIYAVGEWGNIFVFNWRTYATTTIALPSNSYHGICMGIGGDLYITPWSSTKVVKVPILNNGRVLRPIQEINGIIGRHQTGI